MCRARFATSEVNEGEIERRKLEMKFSQTQKTIVIIWTIGFITIGFFPPWLEVCITSKHTICSVSGGYSLILLPYIGSEEGGVINYGFPCLKLGKKIDVSRLIVQWLIWTAATCASLCISMNSGKKQEEGQEKKKDVLNEAIERVFDSKD
jgi:hypothetical protein